MEAMAAADSANGAAERSIYPGHTMDPSEWSRHDPDLKEPRLAARGGDRREAEEHAENLKEAYKFVGEKCGPELVQERRMRLAVFDVD